MKTISISLRALLCSLPLVTAPAFAQDDDSEAGDDEQESTEDDAAEGDEESTDKGAADAKKGEDADAGGEGSEAALAKPVLEETIYVVQGKRFLARGHFEVTPQFVWSVNDSFSAHTGMMISGLYHLKENVALELNAGVFSWWDEPGVSQPRLGGRDTAMTTELRQKENLAPERVKRYQFPYVVAADLQWSPLYGKVDFHELVLGQFNLYLSVGAGIVGLQLETLTAGGPDKTFVELNGPFGALPPVALTTSFGGGLRFYFTEWLGARVEVRDYVTPLSVFQSGENAVADADVPSFDVTNTVLAQVGVSIVF
ncbi:MAG: outer membrane beta-barrel domain-containing protein [Deltaproteobacteria bacterium]|nr:outer membrane beta-barrel domain-containing protein [Deltaproteobacteria bacterium]